MENITNQLPTDPLHGRTLFCTRFIDRRTIAGKRCLDIGCGYGWMELALIECGARSVVGTEVRDKDLSTARRTIRAKNVSFLVGSAIDLPLSDRSFDAVVSWDVIEHIPNHTEPRMFGEVSRVLKQGGIFYLSTPHRGIGTLFDPAFWLIGHRHYTKRALRKVADKTGFRVAHCEIRGGWWEVLGLLDLYISKWIFRRRPFFREFVERKQDQEYLQSTGFSTLFMKLVKKERKG